MARAVRYKQKLWMLTQEAAGSPEPAPTGSKQFLGRWKPWLNSLARNQAKDPESSQIQYHSG